MSEHQAKRSAGITVKDEGPLKGFQTKEARDAALAPPPAEDEDVEPGLAEVEAPPPPEVIRVDAGEANKMVKVRSRKYIEPFRFGKKMYTLPANKEVLIPKAVKTHLEEKGYL